MKAKQALAQKGFVLIEALVAIVVVMVGALGIIKLNAVLLGGTGLTKTQAEALQLAQQRIESMRNYVLSTGCVESTTVGTDTTVLGTNANFRVDTVVSAGAIGSEKVINACVAWDGSSDACTTTSDKRVILKSSVACSGVGTSGLVNEASSGSAGGKLKTPTGAARVGGRENPTCVEGSCVTVQKAEGTIADNTVIYKTGKLVELVDTVTNRVLLTVEDGTDFSTISGRVYIEADNSGNPIVDPQGPTTAEESDDTVFVLSSDASYCARVFPTIPVPSTDAKYHYFDYNCYVSKGWWGNIGVVRLDNPNANNRVCLGDMAVDSTETSIWSKKSDLSISRGYRAYKIKNPDIDTTDQANFETVGIGFSLQGETVSSTYKAVNLGVSRTDSHHDFLVTVINGQGTCESSGNMKLVTGDTKDINQFTGNLGRFFCMSGQCPDLTLADTTQITVVSGTITKGTGAVLTGIDPLDCQEIPTWADNGGTYDYSCTKKWTGFAGSSWQGGISFLTPASPDAGNTTTVCPNDSGSSPTVLPSGYNVAATVNNKLADVNPNSISFTDVALGVTSIIIDLNAEANSCNRLGTPALGWSPDSLASSTMKSLTWSPISSATSYLINTCSLTGNATICTPGTSAGSVNEPTTSYTPDGSAIAGNVKGICVSVTANNGVDTNSIPSSAKCVNASVNKGTTTYSFN